MKTTYGNNQRTRIGELHVASQANVTGEYTYTDTADSTMSVGAESSGGSSFTADGSVSIDNSIGSGGSTRHTDGWVRYVDDTMNYEHLFYSCATYVEPYSSNGDAYDGTLKPGSNPWGSCGNAPYEGTVQSGGGTWFALNKTAVKLSWAFTSFGLYDGNGTTGYEHTDGVKYTNNDSANTHVCGAGGGGEGLDGSPVIYNNPS